MRLSLDDGPKPIAALDKILAALKAHFVTADFYLGLVARLKNDGYSFG